MGDLTIRPLVSLEELEICERLQAEVWQMQPIAVVPVHLLTTLQKNGGLILGAWWGSELVGFVFGFPGLMLHDTGRLRQAKHCSHMAGVLPDWRDKGVGYRLKLAQREHVLKQGIGLITWTFDPLEARNGWLNFGKLGVLARQFQRNVYGQMQDEFNQGLPSDRLEVEWWLESRRVRSRLKGARPDPAEAEAAETVTQVSETPDTGLPLLKSYKLHQDAPVIKVEVPPDFQKIKRLDPQLAHAWRYGVREIFETYLGREYLCTELLVRDDAKLQRPVYVLESCSLPDMLDRPVARFSD